MRGSGVLFAGMQLLSRNRTALICAAGVGVALVAAWLWKKRSRSRGELHQVGVVSQLFIYPVKSCRGISVTEAECTKLGLKHGELRDRHWLVIKEDGHTVTARQEPKLVLISVSSEGGYLSLSAPEMKALHIPLKLPSTNLVWNCRIFGHDVQGKDCGDDTARWINAFLKGSEPYRLVQFEGHMKPRNSKEEFELYRRNDQVVYSDLAPIMLLSEASLEDLNTRLHKKVKIRNFRPCIVVTGCSAYEEGKTLVVTEPKMRDRTSRLQHPGPTATAATGPSHATSKKRTGSTLPPASGKRPVKTAPGGQEVAQKKHLGDVIQKRGILTHQHAKHIRNELTQVQKKGDTLEAKLQQFEERCEEKLNTIQSTLHTVLQKVSTSNQATSTQTPPLGEYLQ